VTLPGTADARPISVRTKVLTGTIPVRRTLPGSSYGAFTQGSVVENIAVVIGRSVGRIASRP
jgi:hypothetical protein